MSAMVSVKLSRIFPCQMLREIVHVMSVVVCDLRLQWISLWC